MSRIGKKPIKVPNDVKVEIVGNLLKIAKGSVVKDYDFGNKVSVVFGDGELKVIPNPDFNKAEVAKYYGLHRSNIANLIKGLIEKYKIKLELKGVGFKAAVVKNMLILTLGYSHDIAFGLPANVLAKVEGTAINLESDDKQLVGEIASQIKSLRKVEPYKGKGVTIAGEFVLTKEGKKK